jgi:hypothetical protein
LPQTNYETIAEADRAVTKEQYHLALELINNPPPGSKLAEAKEWGVDLTLLLENLKLSMTERLSKLYDAAAAFEKFNTEHSKTR